MYDEPIEMINDMIEVVENSYLTVERTEKLTNFLSSLVVSVPRSVAQWFESLTEEEKQLDKLYKLNKRMYLPQNVYDWLNGQNDNFYTIVKNMILFGYNEVQEVIIKSPSTWALKKHIMFIKSMMVEIAISFQDILETLLDSL